MSTNYVQLSKAFRKNVMASFSYEQRGLEPAWFFRGPKRAPLNTSVPYSSFLKMSKKT